MVKDKFIEVKKTLKLKRYVDNIIGNINKEYTKIFIFVISIPDVIGSIGILAFL